MTVIAYRDGIMASDSTSWAGNASHPWATKMARAEDGTLYGVCGRASFGNNFLTWVKDGCVGDWPDLGKEPNGESTLIVLFATVDRKISLLTAYGFETFENAPYMAIGAEAAVALGALYAGVAAPHALLAACQHGDRCRGPIRWMTHDSSSLFYYPDEDIATQFIPKRQF